MQKRRLTAGFTIIELLVVVTVIAILFSISVPVVSSVIRNSRAMICAGNERNLLGAIAAYTSDNSGYLPIPSAIWEGPSAAANGTNVTWAMDQTGVADFSVGTLWPYIASTPQKRAQVLWCPSDDNECYPTVGGGTVVVTRNFSYSMNSNIRWNWDIVPSASLPLRRISHPSLHVAVYEEFAPNDGICFGPGDVDDWLTGRHGPYGTTQYRSNYGGSATNGNGAIINDWMNSGFGNVGYFDGHVALMSVSQYFGQSYHWGPLTQ